MPSTTDPAVYPLCWPTAWPRVESYLRKGGQFNTGRTGNTGRGRPLSLAEAAERVLAELARMDVAAGDVLISTNLERSFSGSFKSTKTPADPGAAVYWRWEGGTRCMAVDAYNSVTANIAAIAATLEAMRAIERHGGAEVLARAFTGFAALAGPQTSNPRTVLGLAPSVSLTHAEINAAYRRRAAELHPDKGGSHEAMSALNLARDKLVQELGA